MKDQLLKKVENIVVNGETARFKQFMLLPQCFQRFFVTDTCICGLHIPMHLKLNDFWNHCGKRRNCSYCEVSHFAAMI